jgi:8-oxo-dGTP diphosphatase
MQRYTMVFAFDPQGRVALIRKNRPDYLAGKWNGIGGKVEPGEGYEVAAVRELREESGLDLLPSELTRCGVFTVEGAYEIHVFRTVLAADHLLSAYTVTDEEVRVFCAQDLHAINMDQHSRMFYQSAVISANHHTNHRTKFHYSSF